MQLCTLGYLHTASSSTARLMVRISLPITIQYNACHKTSCAVTALATVTVVDSDSDIAM